MTPEDLVARCLALKGDRPIVAIAGPPASGKSTLAQSLVERLADRGRRPALVPMDGFHLDNDVLDARTLRDRKGAPETFDAAGFLRLVRALDAGGEVVAPRFDRARDIAIAGAIVVPADCDLVVVEGNYLLLDRPIWRDLSPFWSLAVYLEIPEAELRDRLIDRWQTFGVEAAAGLRRVEDNDLPNARYIARHSRRADVTIAS